MERIVSSCILVAALSFGATPAFAQKLIPLPEQETAWAYSTEKALLKGGLLFLSGAADGLSESLIWHYPRFEQIHPNANPAYWNPYQSWRNKYRNGDPAQGAAYFGSTSFLAWTTDGYHLSRTAGRTMIMGSITISLFEKRRKWWTYPAEFVAGGLVRSAGFHAVYGLYR
jgi:hypothetical protein